jgi:tagaturonate epimerase
MNLGKYSFGVGDRFNHQGEAQLSALITATSEGVEVTPVWNKSNREHNTIHSEPDWYSCRSGCCSKKSGLGGSYFVDADHINLSNVDRFIDHADFFTLDVAMYIGNESSPEDVAAFKKSCASLGSEVNIPGIPEPIQISDESAGRSGRKIPGCS